MFNFWCEWGFSFRYNLPYSTVLTSTRGRFNVSFNVHEEGLGAKGVG